MIVKIFATIKGALLLIKMVNRRFDFDVLRPKRLYKYLQKAILNIPGIKMLNWNVLRIIIKYRHSIL